MSDPTRVILVKPGDVLCFGNVGDGTPGDIARVGNSLKRLLGLRAVLFFQRDVDMTRVELAPDDEVAVISRRESDPEPCPECRSGKCPNCSGWSLVPVQQANGCTGDDTVPCPCKEAGHPTTKENG